MAQIIIKQVTIENKGKYKQATVVYDTIGKFAKEDQSKKVMSFGPSGPVFPVLEEIKSFPVNAEVTSTQTDGFWNWTALKITGSATAAPANTGGGNAPAAVGNYRSSGVSDEVRQKLIVRQSSLERALGFHTLTGNKKATELDIMRTAENFAEYVFKGLESQAQRAVAGMASPTGVADGPDSGEFDEDVPF